MLHFHLSKDLRQTFVSAVPSSVATSVAVHRKAHSEEIHKNNGAKNKAKWSDDQTLVLVQEWKDRVEDLESSRSVEAWNKIVAAVNKPGTEKTLKQCKDKIEKKIKTSLRGCKNKRLKKRPWNQK